MRAIIVDDELDGIGTLKKLLELCCKQVNVVAACNNAVSAKEKIQELRPDVIFLDIQMPGKSGLELLDELPDKNIEIVFVTAHNEYMLQALQFSAADYLLKPVDEDRLIEAVKRVEKKLTEKNDSVNVEDLLHNLHKAGSPNEMKLCIPTLKGFIVLRLEDIIVCEAEKNYTVFYLANRKPITASRTLLDYEELLKDTTFLRVHKSFLINLRHVSEYQRGEGGVVIMTNGMEIEVSRRKKDYFLAKVKEVFRY
jgi:two-component system LytT family response regulator